MTFVARIAFVAALLAVALTDDVRLIYIHSAPYDVPSEGGLDALDPALAIAWPLPVENRSGRDLMLPVSTHGFEGIKL